MTSFAPRRSHVRAPGRTPGRTPDRTPDRTPTWGRPTLTATLTAAVLAGELLVATLATGDAHAQADDPRPPDGAVTPERSRSLEPGALDEPGTPPADPRPDDPVDPPVDVPVDVPTDPPAPAVPEVPSTPPVAAEAPVRTGLGAAVPPLAAPRTARVGDRSHREVGAPRRTGHHEPAQAPPARRDGPVRAAIDPRRARRSTAPRGGSGGSGASAAAGALPAEHTIAPGEHLWSIAAARLAEITGRDPGSIPAEDVAPYWTRVCMVNEARLRSGILSLVYPGEVIELPPA